ncbi:hypothetical protein B0H16DRAFT_1782965 [Mycena metata]|uniref:Protein kinase domain-containing protein n=1 Tax=Mycena metata TaxID=1033252 RepID=A0AAD7KGE8_9AGAR|nr:hypothetical protein B0H16DRAFT_1782965 [Mycena metata]
MFKFVGVILTASSWRLQLFSLIAPITQLLCSLSALMAFISNASNFTLGDGIYTNVQGNIVHHHNNFYGTKRRRDGIEGGSDVLLLTDRSEQRRRSEEGAGNGIKVIRQKNLQLIRQIGSGPGYLLHAGLNKSRAVTVKVFNGNNSMAQQQLDLEVALLKGVIHPNVPRIQGVSSPTSVTHFIAYEDVCGRNAKGPLADALQNRTRSIRLGLKMVADLSAGLGYLSTQSTSLGGMKVENFDVFLDVRDRFLLIINPNSLDEAHANSQSSQDERTWALFNGLCDRVLLSANRVLHTEEIDRDPAVLPPTSAPHKSDSSSFCIGLSSLQNKQEDAGAEPIGSADPRREYVWRAMDRGNRSLATVTDHLTTYLDIALARFQRLTQTDGQRVHRCRGYVREEITLAPTVVDSAVVARDTPRPLEICSICHEIVGLDEEFRCICGDSGPGSRYTVKCAVCKFWSHGDCAGSVELDFICPLCERLMNPISPRAPSFLSGGLPRDRRGRIAQMSLNLVDIKVTEEGDDDLFGDETPGPQVPQGLTERERARAFLEALRSHPHLSVQGGWGLGDGTLDSVRPEEEEEEEDEPPIDAPSFLSGGPRDRRGRIAGNSLNLVGREREREFLEALRSPDIESHANLGFKGGWGLGDGTLDSARPEEEEDESPIFDWDEAQAVVERMVGMSMNG